MSLSPSPAAIAVESRLFGALAVVRVLVLVNAFVVTIVRAGGLLHPGASAVCLGVMVVWTGIATWAYRQPRRRTTLLLAADLALALALLLVTPVVEGADFHATVPGYWIIGAVLAWAIHFRWIGGLGAGALLAAADLLQRQNLQQSDFDNVFLLVLAGSIVGFLCGSLQRMAAEREVAERSAAIATERARLARTVHDGVLQVLALVQRRGRELGGEAGELGRLAREQERELRRVIHAQESVAIQTDSVDLAAELGQLERLPNVTVSTPGFPVELPAGTTHELMAVARACLGNVKLHVGENAPAWVLLQAHPDRIELSVRDDGPGIASGRLADAETEGRLGVSESIRGRIADLGGTAELVTGSFGTEWEFVVPRGMVGSA